MIGIYYFVSVEEPVEMVEEDTEEMMEEEEEMDEEMMEEETSNDVEAGAEVEVEI